MITRVLKSIGWSLLDLILFLILSAVILLILFGLLSLVGLHPFSSISIGNIDEQTSPYPMLLINYLPLLIAFVGASLLTHFKVFHRSYGALGYNMTKAGCLFGRGWLWSLIMVLPGFFILWGAHQLAMLPFSWHWGFVVGYLLFFLVQSAGEEVLTRAYLISMLETRLGTIVAIVLSGSLFAVLHIGNDHFTWIGFVNILLGGFIMALLFVEYRSIWVCTGYHAGWNFLQAGLLDFNVSGVDVYSLVQWKDIGYPRLTGSSFGYEGSLVAVLLQGVLLAYLLKNNSIELNNPFTNSNVQEVPPADNDYDTLISDEVKTES